MHVQILNNIKELLIEIKILLTDNGKMDVKLSHMLLLLVVLAHAFTLIAADKSPNDDTSNSQTVLQPADAAASSHNETGFFTSVRHFFFGDSKTPETGVVGNVFA